MKGVVEYRTPNRLPTPTGSTTGARAIAHWLGNDIQYSPRSVDEWLMLLNGVARGTTKAEYLGTGNAFTVRAKGEWVLIESEYSKESKVCLTTKQASDALIHYGAFLADDFREPSYTAKPLEVEYLAEGSAATEFYAKMTAG
jgi:hypothetical protein